MRREEQLARSRGLAHTDQLDRPSLQYGWTRTACESVCDPLFELDSPAPALEAHSQTQTGADRGRAMDERTWRRSQDSLSPSGKGPTAD
uniref:Uncharacterized protein n=1 Tax=Knipowitschia caucasica TaxID=637954 RepID=A0AAV2L6F6_KNICA